MRRPARPQAINVRGMFGLGDNIMQRPFIRAAAERVPVYLQTPWPELYADLPNVRPVRSQTKLRTQAKNERASSTRWWSRVPGREVRISYGASALERGGIMEAMEQQLPLGGRPFIMDLPRDLGRPVDIDTRGRPLAIIRPVTERAEWHNSARSPLPEYVAAAAERLAGSHHVICVADLQPGAEWLVGPLPVCDQAFLQGELSTPDLLGLMRRADVVVGGVGWIVPASLALGVRAFIYLGGNGGHNAPEKIVDRRVDSSRLGFAVPRNFCRCAAKHHDCEKVIEKPLEQFEQWARRQGVDLC